MLKVIKILFFILNNFEIFAVRITVYFFGLLLCLLLFHFELKYLVKKFRLLGRLVILNYERRIFFISLFCLLIFLRMVILFFLFLLLLFFLVFPFGLWLKLLSIFIFFEDLLNIFLIFHSDFHLLNLALVSVFGLLTQHFIQWVKGNWNILIHESFAFFFFELVFAST